MLAPDDRFVSDLMRRVLSGIALGAAALAVLLFLPLPALRLVACAVAALAADEYLRLVPGVMVRHRAPWWLLVAGTAWYAAAPSVWFLVVLTGVTVLGGIVEWHLVRRSARDSVRMAVSPWYLGVPLGLLVGIYISVGVAATLFLLAIIVVSDSAQFYVGRALGRRPLAPRISPKKTVEGAIGGMLVAVLFVMGAGPRIVPESDLRLLMMMGVSVVGLGICGDLFESSLKRSAGVKDSSMLIPGHGGVLDRIDALLFAVPAFYFFLGSVT